MAVRLLALDIDGTLTNSVHEIPSENLAAIRRAQKAGVFVTVATGRGRYASRNIMKALDVHGPAIYYGGAWILDAPSDVTLQLSPMEPDIVHEVLLLAHRLRTSAQLYQEDTVIAEAENPFTARYVSRFNMPLRIEPHAVDMRFDNVPKILMLTSNDREDEIVSACSEQLGERAAVSRSQKGFIEINRFGVDKSLGLAFAANRLGIPRDETAAVGDSYLDAEMLRWAGTGVCMENGVEKVKQCADLIVPSCDDNGVAYYIDRYVL